jgi:hypothetical protein
MRKLGLFVERVRKHHSPIGAVHDHEHIFEIGIYTTNSKGITTLDWSMCEC